MSLVVEEKKEISPAFAEDGVHQYLQEIRQYPLLTPQQEQELALRCAQDDPEAIRQMVNSNLRLVVANAREFAGRGVPLLDLIQEGSLGLLVAARRFDTSRNLRFSTYATKWIRQGITRCLYQHTSLVRVPLHSAEKLRKIFYAQNTIAQQGRISTNEEVAALSGVPVKTVERLLRQVPEVCSLDAPIGEDGDPMAVAVANLEAPDPQAELVRQELRHHLHRLMETLSDRQQLVLQRHYGLVDGECHSLEEIAQELGVSKERVRQLETRALALLRKKGRCMGLEDFLG